MASANVGTSFSPPVLPLPHWLLAAKVTRASRADTRAMPVRLTKLLGVMAGPRFLLLTLLRRNGRAAAPVGPADAGQPDQQWHGGDVDELQYAVEAVDVLAQLALHVAQLALGRHQVGAELLDLLPVLLGQH